LFGAEPIAVFATSANNGEPRFREVAEMASVILRFPNERLATFTCSFGATRVDSYQLIGTKGDLRVDHAYSTQQPIEYKITLDGKTEEKIFEPKDQLAAEFVYFSNCILQDIEPEPSGQEGLIDVQIIQALHEAIRSDEFVRLDGLVDLSKDRE
jgi:predicted dehydrogenase